VQTTNVLPETDHGFYQRLVFTALRYLPFIDAQIAAASTRSPDDIDPEVRAVLRVAIAEMAYLGTKDHAVVHEAVETVRTVGRANASGFVNAILRTIGKTLPSPKGSADEAYPASIIEIAGSAFGDAEAEEFMTASNSPARVGLRFRSERPHNGARYAETDEDVNLLEQSGAVDIMDPASSMVVVALDPRPGDRAVDLAAAPGGKTRAIADAVGPRGLVCATDIHSRRLRDAAHRSRNIGHIRWLIADALRPPLRPGSFDRVLLDAPCTGLGTMRRRPEIRYRSTRDAPEQYGLLQRELLESALELVAPGGRVVYSVCTISNQETRDVIDGLGFSRPENIEGQPWGDGLLMAPHTTGTDGMFVAVRDA
jgi:16S rRNA (cytosine967-C5)-methyltransferase